jgi:hypothetical protein
MANNPFEIRLSLTNAIADSLFDIAFDESLSDKELAQQLADYKDVAAMILDDLGCEVLELKDGKMICSFSPQN